MNGYTPVTRYEAASRGLTYYYTGKPCARGHVTSRFVSSGNCLDCHRINSRYYVAGLREARKLAEPR